MQEIKKTYFNKEEYPSILEPIHIMQILNMSETKTYQFLKTYPFPYMKIGRLIRVSKEIFIRWSEGEIFKI